MNKTTRFFEQATDLKRAHEGVEGYPEGLENSPMTLELFFDNLQGFIDDPELLDALKRIGDNMERVPEECNSIVKEFATLSTVLTFVPSGTNGYFDKSVNKVLGAVNRVLKGYLCYIEALNKKRNIDPTDEEAMKEAKEDIGKNYDYLQMHKMDALKTLINL